MSHSDKLPAILTGALLFSVALSVEAAKGVTYDNSGGDKERTQATTGKQENAEDGNFVDDAGLTAKVKSALATDAGLKTLKLNVDSKQGAVTITGVVKNAREKETIDRVVRAVSGVKSVNNAVTVQP